MHRGRPMFLIPHSIPTSTDFEEIVAPYLLGAVWNWCLYGALVVQFYVYSYNFPRDNRNTKLLVYGTILWQTVQTALTGASLYYWFIDDFGNSNHLEIVHTSFLSFIDLPIMGSVACLTAQLFFAHCILVLGEKRSQWLCVIICLVSTVGALGKLAMGVFSLLVTFQVTISYEVYTRVFNTTWYAGLVGSTLSDMLIASSMLYHLRRIWVKDGKLSNHAFVSTVRWMVETNLVTTIVSIVALLMTVRYPDKGWNVCPLFILGKLHSNTLLVSLNNRALIRDSYEARGAVVDRQVVTVRGSSAGPVFTTGAKILETVKPQNLCMNEVVEVKIEERGSNVV